MEDIEKAAAKVEGGIQEGDWVLICTGMNKRCLLYTSRCV